MPNSIFSDRRAGGRNKHCATGPPLFTFFSGNSAPPGNKNTFFCVFLHIPQYFGLRGTQDPSQEGPKTPPRGVVTKTVTSWVPECQGCRILVICRYKGYVGLYTAYMRYFILPEAYFILPETYLSFQKHIYPSRNSFILPETYLVLPEACCP